MDSNFTFTYEDLRLFIIESCQDCYYLSYCMYSDSIFDKISGLSCFLSTSISLDLLYQL